MPTAMIHRLTNRLEALATGRVILVFFGLAMIFAVLIVPTVGAQIEGYSGGVSLIDLNLTYSPQTAREMVGAYGAEGRSLYRLFALTGDVLYPVVYSTLTALLITWLFRRGGPAVWRWRAVALVPFGAMIFDWLENVGIVTMLSLYPNFPNWVARAASICTTTKWAFGVAAVLLVLFGLVAALRNGFKSGSA